MQWSLLVGPFPIVLLTAAIAGLIVLALRRPARRWWTVAVPVAAGVGLVGTLAIDWFVTAVWRPFPDSLPTVAVVWIGLIIAALVLTAWNIVLGGNVRRAVAVIAVLAVMCGGINEINRTYGDTPTLAALAGSVHARQVPLPALADDTVAAMPVTWRLPEGAEHSGAVARVAIPGVVSHFSARDAWIYFPPAYFADPRPRLPVLMLLPGQPGTPRDWIDAGHAVPTLDRFAASHGGLAPIVVMPDATGSVLANTLCADTPRGNAATYLTRDVPDWLRTHLQLDEDTAHWAIGGFSFGGTCAAQLALAYPSLFPTFLDISGQAVATLGGRERTVRAAFGGDVAAYDAIQPLSILGHDRADPAARAALARSEGIFVVGASDTEHRRDEATMVDACAGAGLATRSLTVPGIHSWYVPAEALRRVLPHIAGRLGLA